MRLPMFDQYRQLEMMTMLLMLLVSAATSSASRPSQDGGLSRDETIEASMRSSPSDGRYLGVDVDLDDNEIALDNVSTRKPSFTTRFRFVSSRLVDVESPTLSKTNKKSTISIKPTKPTVQKRNGLESQYQGSSERSLEVSRYNVSTTTSVRRKALRKTATSSRSVDTLFARSSYNSTNDTYPAIEHYKTSSDNHDSNELGIENELFDGNHPVVNVDADQTPCVISGRLEIQQNWYGYLAAFNLSAHGASILYRVRYPEARCCMKLLLYLREQVREMRYHMNCVQKQALLNMSGPQVVWLSPAIEHSGCVNVSVPTSPEEEGGDEGGSGKRLIQCHGGRTVRTSRVRTWYVAASSCLSPKGLNVEYTLVVRGVVGSCPNSTSTHNDRSDATSTLWLTPVMRRFCRTNNVLALIILHYLKYSFV